MATIAVVLTVPLLLIATIEAESPTSYSLLELSNSPTGYKTTLTVDGTTSVITDIHVQTDTIKALKTITFPTPPLKVSVEIDQN